MSEKGGLKYDIMYVLYSMYNTVLLDQKSVEKKFQEITPLCMYMYICTLRGV